MTQMTTRLSLSAALLLSTTLSHWTSAQTPGDAPPPPAPPGQNAPPRPGPAGQTRPPGPMQRVLDGYREILMTLQLSPDQRQAVTGIMQEQMGKLREIAMELQQATPDERRAKMAEFMQDLNGQIREQLDDTQKAKFDAAFAEMIQNQRNPNANPATSRPSSRPADNRENRRAGNAQQSPATRILQGFKSAVDSLDLTADQKTKVAAAFDEAKAKLEAIEPGDPAAREQQRAITDNLREKLLEILTPEQQTALRERMQNQPRGNRPGNNQPPGNNPPPRGQNPGPPPPMPPGLGEPGPMQPLDTPPPPPPRADASPNNAPTPTASASTPDLGSPAPPLSLKKLDGSPVRLSSFQARSLVLVFGSYSTPSFREKARFLNDLQQDYRGRADFLVVYTAEAHPVGSPDIERNLDDKVRIETHRSEADRLAAAKSARDSLKLQVPITIDDMDNTTATSYAALPNGAVVITRDGNIAAQQKWFEPFALRRILDDLAKRKAATTP